MRFSWPPGEVLDKYLNECTLKIYVICTLKSAVTAANVKLFLAGVVPGFRHYEVSSSLAAIYPPMRQKSYTTTK